MNLDHTMQKVVPASGEGAVNDAPNVGLRRSVIWSLGLVLAFTLMTLATTSKIVTSHNRRAMENEMRLRVAAVARNIDQRLRISTAALNTIAESHALWEQFNLPVIEWEARRVGALFGGWFVLSRGGDTMEILLSTADSEGRLPLPGPRSNYPEVLRAETESMRTGKPVVSDAFKGLIIDDLVITIVKPVEAPTLPVGFVYFSFSLQDITRWLEEALLGKEEFIGIADGSRRVIARSENNEDFLLAELPEWYISFSDERNQGVAVGPPVNGGTERVFAMKRLELAPNWTLALSSPVPNQFAVLYQSPWPLLSTIASLFLGAGIVAIYRDRRTARARDIARDALLSEVRAADARKARLMSVLVHDLRTPLVAMLGALDLLREDANQSAQAKIVKRLKTDGHGMLSLIDDVLELARLGAGEARLRPEPFELKALLEQVRDVVQLSAKRHGIEVVINVDTTRSFVGDVPSLRRILLNFATNAVKATHGGTIQISADLGNVSPKGRVVTFAVTDTGCGIAPEDIPRLFRDFGMLERDSVRSDGTGLGLAICRRLAAAMGGEVGVESILGKGSRFWLKVTLPEADKLEYKQDHETGDRYAALAGLKVLVVEDHHVIRQLTCANLARVGMQPTEANDGTVAVELAEAKEFDLILMDLRLPGLDGDEAAARIRRKNGPSARTRIICVTSHQSPEIALMLSDLAFDACVRKPLDLNHLADLIEGEPAFSHAFDSPLDFSSDNLTLMREIDDGALLNKTLTSFLADIEMTRNKLAELIAKRDTLEASRLVHRLVGFGDIIGARTLSAELRKLEDMLLDDDTEALESALERVDHVMANTRAQVNKLIEENNRMSKM